MKEFPSDPMLRDIHFIRELMDIIGKRAQDVPSYRERGFIARKEFTELLKAHPELEDPH
ncbi:MAG: hypothetical protein U9N46_02900 [Euryarchaeota archaeon]|nr:hypothetical protein [Euryarchaeota archaeon]